MKFKIIFCFVTVLMLASCDLEVEPFDGITKDNLAKVPNALLTATNGAYAMMKDQLPYKEIPDYRSTYARNVHQMLEYAGDNVTLSGTTTDPLFYAATREHFPAMENSTYVWNVAYRIVNTANQNIESVPEGQSATNDYLLGENYFLRGMAFFDLLRLFARPYSHGVGNRGIILRISSSSPDNMARATVGESYAQVEADLLKAAALMENGESRGPEYGSKVAAWALLSRLYLYMEQNEKAIEFSTKVIESPGYSLVTADKYLDSFYNSYNSDESIFVIKHLLQDDRSTGSIGSMYLTDRGIGWGEIFASLPLRTLLGAHPEDIRNSLIKPQYEADGITIAKRNGIDKYFITKHSYQDDVVTLNSPHVIRLAEMYLNRAEAHAKLSHHEEALDDANVIRARAGIAEEDWYTLGNLQGATSVLDAVLRERRMELAYEGHRAIDVFRNKLSMDRTFPGYQPHEVINWDNLRNIYFIPQDELLYNDLAEQND